MNLLNPTVALRQSLLALAIVRRGRLSGDNAVVNEGRRMYGRVLCVLQRDLYDEQRASYEETLVATRVMARYEVSPTPPSDLNLLGLCLTVISYMKPPPTPLRLGRATSQGLQA